MANNPFQFRPVAYTSNDVPIPDSFLTTAPSRPITSRAIDFTSGGLPQYALCKALVLDNVLSPEECKQLLLLAEASVPIKQDAAAAAGENVSLWQPAMVSIGPKLEAPAPGYRESDRIIWDQQTVVDRLWERCAQAEGLKEMLATASDPYDKKPGVWEFRRYNERMRFLKYSPGQHFKPHVDGPYWYEDGGREFLTHYTVHLYLNDSVESDSGAELVGGATAFLSRDRNTRLDVNPRAGSVLIFQHSKLLHEGSEVKKGVKFTMRTDILYEWVPKKKQNGSCKGK